MMKPFHTAWAIKQSFVREFCSSFLSMFRVPTFIWFWIFYQDGKSIRLHCKSMMGFDNERHVLFAGKNMLEPLRKFKTSRISLYLDSLLSLNEWIYRVACFSHVFKCPSPYWLFDKSNSLSTQQHQQLRTSSAKTEVNTKYICTFSQSASFQLLTLCVY